LFACEQEEVQPDIVCIAKGLGAGYQPIGAMICTDRIYDVLGNGSGLFQHGHTYVGHPTACAAGLAVVNAMLDRDLLPQVRDRGRQLRAALDEAFGQSPIVGDIRGRGMFLGIEFVADRDSKAPFDPALNVAGQFKAAAFDAGLICYPMRGTRDGTLGDHVLLAPPFITAPEQVSEIVEKLAIAMGELDL
jgi:adenosylmethionine-8-amino-7-oxononanoate aminotransferase